MESGEMIYIVTPQREIHTAVVVRWDGETTVVRLHGERELIYLRGLGVPNVDSYVGFVTEDDARDYLN